MTIAMSQPGAPPARGLRRLPRVGDVGPRSVPDRLVSPTWAAGTTLLLLSTLLNLHPERPDANVEAPCDIGQLALHSHRD